MVKILILNQCTLSPSYKDVEKAMKETWQQIKHPNVTIINYYGSESNNNKQCEYFPEGNKMVINVGDEHSTYLDENNTEYTFDSRGEKFILALEYCLKNLDFDYIYRMSCTSYIDVYRMYDFINSLEREKVYSGAFNMYQYKHYFVSGFNVIMSKDVVEQLVNNKEQYLKIKHPEDLATGILLFDYLKYLEDFNSQNQAPTHFISSDVCAHPSIILPPSTVFNFKFPRNLAYNFNRLHDFLKVNGKFDNITI